MNTIKSLGARALLVVLLGGVGASPAQSADPFYERLLERGVQDLELGLVNEARQKLRIASFGFLDEPVLLARALAQLGRAQARGGESGELTDTAMRLVEIEDRFGAYSEIDEALKASFESSLRGALPQELLERLDLFRHLVVDADAPEDAAASLTPKQRIKRLEQELAAEPDSVPALLELAQIYSDRGKAKPAAQLLDRLLSVEPGNEEALCLRSRLAIDRKQCAPALAGLELCGQITATGAEDAFVLDCLISAGRVEDGAAYVDRLPPDRRQAPKLERAARKLAAPADVAAEEPVEAEVPSEQSPEPAAENGSGEPAVESAPPDPAEAPAERDPSENESEPALDERLATLRAEVRDSRFREQLEDALTEAVTLAEDHPDSVEAQHLAAEIAYLGAEWQMVADYFDRGGLPDRAELVFYLAVAHYELGNRREAEATLRPVLDELARTPFVDGYIDRILEPPPS